MNNWDNLIHFLQNKQRILVTTHVNPDGDAIGSEMAISHYLHQIGKEVILINSDPTPHFFQFLDPSKQIITFNADQHHDLLCSAHGCIALDISDWERLAHIGKLIRQHAIPIACIDHHIPTDQFGTTQIIDQNASSTGELLYEFLLHIHCQMTQEIIDALYTCIMTDTGSFRYSNTTAHTHTISADLLQKGARFQTIYGNIYEQYSKERIHLMGRLMVNMQFACNDRLAYLTLSQSLLKESGAHIWETEGFSDLPRHIASVEISIIFTETSNRQTKVSFRSKGRIPINGLATQFGGGGHQYASGATLPLGLNEAVKVVIIEANKLFTNFK